METRSGDTPATMVRSTTRPDGAILLESGLSLEACSGTLAGRLAYWAARTPDAIWLTEAGRSISYADAHRERRRLSSALLPLRHANRPIAIMAANSIDHALTMLAATAVGIPAAIISPAYAAASARPWRKLATILAQIEPMLIFSDDEERLAEALAASDCPPPVVAIAGGEWTNRRTPASEASLKAAEDTVDGDTIAKLLLTSGSTGHPKAVINTQRMMVSNMMALGLLWPFLSERAPVMVDWLPWSHTFGGNCCFNIALWFGGHFRIDRGRPSPESIRLTLDAIRETKPTIYFNVPLGHELLVAELERDTALATHFFEGLDFLFNAGAALPDTLRQRLARVAEAATGTPPRIVGGWGSTETAPFSTLLDMPTDRAANLGLPIPGTAIKMVPLDGRYELRVKGPNVTPGYWRDVTATAAAFDEEGFYRIGDAGKFADPEDVSKGIIFDGRVAENFKLASGTFVNVGALRLAIVDACGGLVSDAVVTGEGRVDLGLLLFLNESACRVLISSTDEALSASPGIIAALGERLALHNASASGSSTRISRFVIAAAPLMAQVSVV